MWEGQGAEEYPTWNTKRKANWIGHILRRNYLPQRVTEGKIQGGIEVTGRRGRRRKLLDDLKERRGYCHLEEEALDRTVWGAGCGRGFGPVVRQTAKWMNELYSYGTTVVYAARRWPKRRYAAHHYTWKITSLLDESELSMITLTLDASGRRKAELQVLCKASFGTEIYATLQSGRRINLWR
jgi:hypothetical protein